MMSDSEVRPSVQGILTKLWHRVEDGLDLREATPEEKQRIGHIRDGQHVMEHGDGIGQHVKAEHGRLYMVGEKWARAVSWEGFIEDRGFDKEKGGPVPRTVHWGPVLGAVLDALEGKGGLTLSDDDRRCLAFIERLRVDLFLQHLDNLGVTWRDEPAEPKPANAGEGKPDALVTLDQAAGLCGTSKRTLERLLKAGMLPEPDFPGGGGKAHKWKWPNLRPALIDHVRADLPEQFPASRIV